MTQPMEEIAHIVHIHINSEPVCDIETFHLIEGDSK
jgi:hypothetical protein